MNVRILEDTFKNMILYAVTPIPHITLDHGIRFLLTSPFSQTSGAMYVGLLSEWNQLLDKQQIVDGNTYLICTDDENTKMKLPENITINVILFNSTLRSLMQKITILLQQTKDTQTKSLEQIYFSFWDDIMQGDLTDHEKTLQRIEDFPYPIFDTITCIVIRPEMQPLDSLMIQEIDRKLKEIFVRTNLFYKNNEWIVLFSSESILLPDVIKNPLFAKLLEDYKLNAGFSYAGHWPELLRTLYLTAASSINLGTKLKNKPKQNRIYTYKQYNPYYVIHLCAQKFIEVHNHDRLIYLVHPDIIELYEYDKKHRNNLLEVLYTYLMNGHNISLTAKVLYMHRNTVANKLAKIQQMIHNDLDDGESQFHLLLSCMIVEYQENYVNRRIR